MKQTGDDVYDRPTDAGGAVPSPESLSNRETPGVTPDALHVDASQTFPVAAWDRYQFVAFLGEGGMGRVYKAVDPRLKRHVALKFIRGDDPELNRRFLLEAQAQARVDHPNVCKIYEVGEVQGRLFIALPFLDGESLLDAAKSMSLEQKVRVMQQVAEGLHAAHRIGLVHRDVKPGNILVETTEEGGAHPYVMDFGLAREAAAEGMTVSGSIVGTPWYMSPEQALGRVHLLDRRSDVFSVGATLYELFSGHPPFEGQSPMDVLRRIIEEDAAPLSKVVPGFPADLDTIVLKCLEREPAHRYDSARALAEDLQRYLEGEPILARPLSMAGKFVKRAKKNVALTAALAAIVLMIFGGTAWAVRNALVTRRQTELAQSLGQDVKEVEVLLRFASYMLPLHDVSRERGMVRARLTKLEERVAQLGAAGEGPGRYALGRGYLALGELEKAQTHLSAAWEAGFRSPDESYALGLTLARRYEQEIRGLTNAPTSAERSRRKKELEETLKKPALQHLQEAKGVRIDAPEMVTALVADMEGNFDRAIAESRRAAERVPWLYEARAFEARSLRRRANTLRDAGKDEAALADYQRAEEALLAAVEVGRSYPDGYQGLCSLYSEMMDLDWKRKLAPVEKFRLAADWCGKAVACDPGNILPLLRISDVYWRWAEYQTSAGEDPRPILAMSIAAAEKTIRSAFDLAYTYDNLGIAWQQQANWESRHGVDPAASYQKAIDAYGVVLEKYPALFSTYCNAAFVRADAASWETRSGRDPSSLLGKAREILAKGRAVTSDYCLISAEAMVEFEALRWDVTSGVDPSPAFRRVEPVIAALRAANPTLVETELYAARAHLLEARVEARNRRTPDTALGKVERALARISELNGDTKELPLYRAEVLALRGLAGGATQDFVRTERLFEEARRKDPLGTEPRVASARFLLESGRRKGQLAAPDASQGLDLVDKALSVDPALAEAWMMKAAFLRALGRGGEAAECGKRGLERNPLVLTAWPELKE